ncbi:MAG: Gfo/Idh/MocA family oxidoreductase [Bryobacterales bacterium]|nr:Gfo/Idh/MocA family oxidoreductase [Bryobacterales bacterium]
MLKVAIVGCGKIADDHASQIERIRDCRIVAVCDREPLMARQLCERFAVERYFSDVAEMLRLAAPDVVHVTSPPESHFEIAKLCLENNCHVYVEKPFTLYAAEARRLIAIAEERGLKITAGHDAQFSHVSRRMREAVQGGFLGGPPVHIESYYCYSLGGDPYADALLGDKGHWVRRLPGKLLQNIISHGIARIAEFLVTESPVVIAHGFPSPYLQSAGETELIDELRVIICEEKRTTAFFTFSSQMRPALHQLRLYGPKNGLILDQDSETLVKLRGAKRLSYLQKFAPPIDFVRQYMNNFAGNAKRFLRNDFHMKAGMKYLIEAFYGSIAQGAPPPIPYREIVLTATIMDAIIAQVEPQNRQADCVHGANDLTPGNVRTGNSKRGL